MVATTSDTFQNLFAKLEKDYEEAAPAQALFWKRFLGDNKYDYGLRVEAPTIMKEFTNNVNLGTDPEGFLFYDDIKDFDNSTVYYNIYYSTATKATDKAVVVQFWHLDDNQTITDPGEYFAQFLAKDLNGVVNYTLAKQSGLWKDLKIGTGTAHVKKYTHKSEITVKIPAIRREATFKVKDNKDKVAVDVWGNLTFLDIDKLTSPSSTKSYADYNPDRIIFYPTSGSTGSVNFTAYFIPLDSAPADSLGGNKLVFEADSVLWSSYNPDA